MTVTISTIRVNDVNLSYKEWPGEKGPLICLPSLVGQKESFDGISSRLSPEYHSFVLDLRGRGDSDKPAEGYGFAYHTRDILAFADALGLDTFAIVGHSFGATVGVYAASIRPGRIKALVMLDGGADPKEEVLQAMRPAIDRLGKVYASVDAYLEAMRALPYYSPWNQALEEYLRSEIVALPEGGFQAKSSPDVIKRDLDIHFFYSMCVHFPTLQCPTLFVRPQNGLLGDKAHVMDEREAAAFVAWIPNCWRVDLPGVNHFTMVLSNKPLVVPPIQAFLSTVLSE